MKLPGGSQPVHVLPEASGQYWGDQYGAEGGEQQDEAALALAKGKGKGKGFKGKGKGKVCINCGSKEHTISQCKKALVPE